MEEQQKHAIVFAVTILSARGIQESMTDKPNPAKEYYIDGAIKALID
jgi:hypothetical protein